MHVGREEHGLIKRDFSDKRRNLGCEVVASELNLELDVTIRWAAGLYQQKNLEEIGFWKVSN